MTKKYFSVLGIILSVISLSVLTATQGYSDDLFKATLIGASASYSNEVEAKISIKDTGKVELSIKGLRSSSDNELVNQNSILVIETEVSESAKTYSKSFTITDGKAEEEFTLEDLDKDDKLEITSVVINKVTSTTPTPTVTASPTSSPTATPIATASPTPESSPTTTPTATASPTPTGTAIYSLVIKAQTSADDAILVPGGIISESTTGATPTPTVTASPTPGASPTSSPAVIEAEVSIKPETFNLNSKGNFKAFITLPSPYSVNNIDVNTVECEGAQAIDGKVDKNRFIATFRVQDLDLGFDIKVHKGRDDKKVKVELTVSGELNDGTKFEGSDEVSIKGKKKEDDDDDE
ncbi:MAG: hypothetical protein HY607_00350 [Planctomycetes bacterium]|nr:hypothetical protein [Planctomycetota bacterium]MBI4221120.1 hypothetical protein [Planctomycetota bacterium]